MKTTIIGILLSPFLLMAQQNAGAWTNIGPRPAAITARVLVDPQRGGNMFIGLLTGGIRKSTDSGMTWSSVNNGLTDLRILAAAMDASGPQTIYAAAFAGIFKSIDGGRSWQSLATGPGGPTTVTADPNRSGVVYAAVSTGLTNGSITKSTDGGATWSTLFPLTAPIYNITVDPANSDIVYAPTMGRGAFKSTDGGQRWFPMSALSPTAISIIVVDLSDSQVLYAGTNDDGVWKSHDGGATWQNLSFPASLPVYSLTIDPSPSHDVYAGTNGGGIWRSSDGGISWESTGLSSGRLMSLSMDSAGALYASTSSAGAQVSRDRGVTWTTLDAGIAGTSKYTYGCWIDPSNGQKLFASGLSEYLNWSQDGGATWSDAGPGFTGRGSRKVAFDPSNPRRIYASGTVGDGVFKSEDGGLTWARLRFGSPAVNVITVAVDSLSPNIVYAGTQNEGVFKSADYGDTWKAAGSGLSGAITGLTSDPSKSGRLLVASSTAFFLSEDGAETWTNILNRPAWTITIDSKSASTVYAVTRTQGVFRSLDGGRTWQDINNGLTSLTMGRNAPVTIDPKSPQTLHVGSEVGGVFKSLDGGDHWFAVNAGLGDLSVWGLVVDPDNSSVLYACGPSGVYKTLTGGEVRSASIAVSAVVNGASLLPGAVSPGEIVVLSGSGLGPDQLIPATAGANGLYNAQLSGTTVQFNGASAPVIYTSAAQVAVQVPDSIPTGTARIVVTYEGRTSASFPVQVTQYAPGVFTLDLSGKGQAIAVNQDGTINAGATPARVGDVLSLYATGVGEGDLTVRIGSQSAVLSSIKKTGGVVQIGVRMPGGVQTGSLVPVVLQVGSTSSQPGVTVAVLPQTPTQSGTFAATGRMIAPRFLHTTTLLFDGRVLITGGDSSYAASTNAESSAELFDSVAGTFVLTGSMTTPRDGHSATLLPNGKVLIAGGGPRINGRGYSLASAELYDSATGTFSATGSMTVERSSHTATLLNDGKVLIAGGVRIVIGGSPSNVTFPTSAELYDPATGTFTPTGDTHGRFVDTATLLTDGKVLITSGNPEAGPYLSSAELYDPSTGKFTSAGYLNVNHTGPSATLLMNGKVLIAGGDIGDGDGPSVIAELYDPATGKFTATGRLTTGREQNATTLLPDGTVLFTGGHGGVPVPGGGFDNLASAEIYNPLSGAFSAVGAMLTGRDILGATLLNDGQVLITGGNEYYPCCAGGRDPQHPVVSVAELYRPAMLIPAPALFSLGGDGRGQGAIWHATTGEIASLSSPAVAGEVLTMYTTSLADRGVIPPQVAIGGRLAEVLYYGSAPGYPGYYQVNFRMPNGVAPGPAVPVRLTYLGRPSNAVTIGVR